MQVFAAFTMLLASVLNPARGWYPADAPFTVQVKSEGEARLVLTDFAGNKIDAKPGGEINGEATKDLKQVFERVAQPGTYLLYVVPKGKELPEFQGTPLVINVYEDKREGAPPGPVVTRVQPLRYAVMTTKQGSMTMAFYYDVAPNTVDSFLRLADQKFYDGLTFHRILPGFVLQGGDPRGDGTGGPGYQIDAEFNDRPHREGVLSMARGGDEGERQGRPPGPVAANSAGSQFFICLDYKGTQQLDNKYTAFGKVTDGMKGAHEIAKVELEDPRAGRPKERQVIEKVEVKPVTAAENPYPAIQKDLAAGRPPGQ